MLAVSLVQVSLYLFTLSLSLLLFDNVRQVLAYNFCWVCQFLAGEVMKDCSLKRVF